MTAAEYVQRVHWVKRTGCIGRTHESGRWVFYPGERFIGPAQAFLFWHEARQTAERAAGIGAPE